MCQSLFWLPSVFQELRELFGNSGKRGGIAQRLEEREGLFIACLGFRSQGGPIEMRVPFGLGYFPQEKQGSTVQRQVWSDF